MGWRKANELLRKTIILSANLLLNNRIAFGFLGLINGKFKIIASIFFDYPVSNTYSDYYTFDWFRKVAMNWSKPALSGLIVFNGKLIIKFSFDKTPEDLTLADNTKGLESLYRKAKAIADSLEVEDISFAGILPGVLFRRKLIKNRRFSVVTAKVVSSALDKIFSENNLSDEYPIVLIGGAGFVGRMVTEEMEKRGRNFFVVDIKEDNGTWPKELEKNPSVILNLISDNKGLINYLDQMVPGSIFVNEAYPPPDNAFLERAKKNGIKLFHICGAEADIVWPSFPEHYSVDQAKSMPCCAVPLSLIEKGAKPVLQRL